eukprot:gene19635-26320_t
MLLILTAACTLVFVNALLQGGGALTVVKVSGALLIVTFLVAILKNNSQETTFALFKRQYLANYKYLRYNDKVAAILFHLEFLKLYNPHDYKMFTDNMETFLAMFNMHMATVALSRVQLQQFIDTRHAIVDVLDTFVPSCPASYARAISSCSKRFQALSYAMVRKIERANKLRMFESPAPFN